jgi:hypothetical protein
VVLGSCLVAWEIAWALLEGDSRGWCLAGSH